MKARTYDQLQHFVGKVCTVFTGPINRGFEERQAIDYFVGVVEGIDETGILTYHPITKCKNYFFLHGVLGISEEQTLDPDNPEHAQMIEEFRKKKTREDQEPMPPPLHPQAAPDDSPFIDIEQLAKLTGN